MGGVTGAGSEAEQKAQSQTQKLPAMMMPTAASAASLVQQYATSSAAGLLGSLLRDGEPVKLSADDQVCAALLCKIRKTKKII